jgi:hypothetical protein
LTISAAILADSAATLPLPAPIQPFFAADGPCIAAVLGWQVATPQLALSISATCRSIPVWLTPSGAGRARSCPGRVRPAPGRPRPCLIRIQIHRNRTRSRRFRQRDGHVDPNRSMPDPEWAASDANDTHSGADLVMNAADQASYAAEEVFNSLRDPASGALAIAVSVVLTRFEQTPRVGREARRGFQRNGRDRSQLPCGSGRRALRQCKARRGPDPSNTTRTQPRRASHDSVRIGTPARKRIQQFRGKCSRWPLK